MTVLAVLLAATVAAPSPPLMPMPLGLVRQPPSADEPDLDEAKRLFNEGQSRYDAADYDGAIETFTLALSEVRDQGVHDFVVVGQLMFNIGRAHVRAYEIDRKVEHLRQAEAIFSRFLDGAAAAPGEVVDGDVADARAQLEQIQTQLAELEAEAEAEAEAGSEAEAVGSDPGSVDAAGPEAGTEDDVGSGEDGDGYGDAAAAAARHRRLGAGLIGGGVALLGGGVGALVWGLGYKAAAESQVAELDSLGLPPEHPAFGEGARFIEAEQGKGTAWMAAGGVAATLGLTGVALGIAQLARASRPKEPGQARSPQLGASAMIGPDGLRVGVHGRF